jgi:hypothetical protein
MSRAEDSGRPCKDNCGKQGIRYINRFTGTVVTTQGRCNGCQKKRYKKVKVTFVPGIDRFRSKEVNLVQL